MKLYHGSICNLKVGDYLRTDLDKSWGLNVSVPVVYATTSFKMATEYSIAPAHIMDFVPRDIVLIANKTLIFRDWVTQTYVYNIEPAGFELLVDYENGDGDEWISACDAKIIGRVQISPEMMAKYGYDVRVINGGRIRKKLLFRMAASKIAHRYMIKRYDKFEGWISKYTTKVQE